MRSSASPPDAHGPRSSPSIAARRSGSTISTEAGGIAEPYYPPAKIPCLRLALRDAARGDRRPALTTGRWRFVTGRWRFVVQNDSTADSPLEETRFELLVPSTTAALAHRTAV